MNKISKTRDLLLVTELIFCNTPKANRKKTYWLFVEGTRVMLTSGLAYKHTSSLPHSNDPFTQKYQCDWFIPYCWVGHLSFHWRCSSCAAPAHLCRLQMVCRPSPSWTIRICRKPPNEHLHNSNPLSQKTHIHGAATQPLDVTVSFEGLRFVWPANVTKQHTTPHTEHDDINLNKLIKIMKDLPHSISSYNIL